MEKQYIKGKVILFFDFRKQECNFHYFSYRLKLLS